MSIRERFKSFQGRVKESTRQIFGAGSGLARAPSAGSLPTPSAQVVSPSASRIPHTLTTLTAPDPVPRPASAPPGGDQAVFTSPASPPGIGSNLEIRSLGVSPAPGAVTLNPDQNPGSLPISPGGSEPALASGGGSTVPINSLPDIQIIPAGGIPVPSASALPDEINPIPSTISPTPNLGQAELGGASSPARVPLDLPVVPTTSSSSPRLFPTSNTSDPIPVPVPALSGDGSVPHSNGQTAMASGDNPAAPAQSLPDAEIIPANFSTGPDSGSVVISNDPDPVSRLVPASSIGGVAKLTGSETIIDKGWKCLGGFVEVLKKGSTQFGPLKLVMDEFVNCVDMHEDSMAARRDYAALKVELEALITELSNHFSSDVPPTMTASMENLCSAIEKELDRISTKEERQAWRRHREALKDLDDVMDCYRRIHGHLERLNINANLSIWKLVDKQTTDAQLDRLSPSMSACYNSAEAALVRRRECTPKTRERVLLDLGIWRHDKQQGNLYWMNGMAGTGKTTIASSLCAMLDQSHELGASFFCTRLLPECRQVKLILPTISYQLARFSHPFRRALCRALEHDPDVHTKALQNQLEGMIVGPLREVANTLPMDLVAVIDALDECDDSQGVGLLLKLLVGRASELPIKIFVSSRPEPQIRQMVDGMKSKLVLHELEHSIVKQDIRTYLQIELASMSISESDLTALVERAGILFIYAATVVRYIGAKDFTMNPQRRLAVVLKASTSASSNQNKDIDTLYSTVLESAFSDFELEDNDREQMKLVLDTVICAQEPLTLEALAEILQLGEASQVDTSLRPLWSVLHISNPGSLVTTLHASFPDYMLDPKRSHKHTCAADVHHGQLTSLCFERIRKNQCQFNICGLQSSYLFDSEVLDLDERVERAIPLDLAYVCRYWAVHLELGCQSNKQLQFLDEFLSKRLLLWMEVLNLTKNMHSGATSLDKAREWCKKANGSQEANDLIHDAWRFVTMFAAGSVSRSTPHVYVSMLASWPRSRPIAGHYIQRTRGLAEIRGTGMMRRQLAMLSAIAVESEVNSVALSPDGMRLVSGSKDKKVRVWDMRSGQVLAPLEGHTSSVNSVAFSPDGMHIVSGSDDETIHIWDLRSGKLPALLKGHNYSVLSVAFSPDGTRIVSGCTDGTVRVWDLRSGPQIQAPLKGHTDWVRSVAFSPDSLRIVSGSDDNAIHLWDVQSGQQMLAQLKGHTGWVRSVAFSPDSLRIVSGSNDKTIRLWEVQSGQQVIAPLRGHTFSVNSVAFSPDGMRIVSGSDDMTIRVWDVQSGQQVLAPFEGHTSTVKSVAFSPDGIRVVSGSGDKTIRVWDIQSRQQVPAPLEGHTDSVNSVAFSPDSKRIVSSSSNKTMRMWDVQSGKLILAPLEGHADLIRSVAFSPDGMCIAAGSDDNTIYLADVQSGQQVAAPLKGHTDWVRSVAFSPDGMRIASGSDDMTIRLWDVRSGQQVLAPLKGHTDWIYSVAFSPHSLLIASGSKDSRIGVWDAQSGQQVLPLLNGHTNSVNSVSFSPNSLRIVSGSHDKTVRIWDVQSGQQVLPPLEGHTDWVKSVAFSPDGMRIVSGSDDKTIRLWDVQSGQQLRAALEGHTFYVNSVAFSLDGMRIVSGSGDNTIRVWDAQTDHQTLNDVPHTNPKLLPAPGPQPLPDSITAESARNSSTLCVLDKDGWLLDENRHVLFWVPPDLRDRLLANRTVMLISTQGSVYVDFTDAKIGESWAECYTPAD